MTVSSDDPRPSYAQVADHLLRAVEGGVYPVGSRLPSGRDLAKEFGVALNTVQRAISELKSQGVLVSHPPRGVFVQSTTRTADPDSEGYTEITEHLETLQRLVQELSQRLDHVEQAVQANPPAGSGRPQQGDR